MGYQTVKMNRSCARYIKPETTSVKGSVRARLLFEYMRDLVEHKKWYADPEFSIHRLIEYLGCTELFWSNAVRMGTGGKTFRQYLLDLRLARAAKLLRNREQMPVNEVGLASGFRSRASFFRQFKENLGCSPNEYRKLNQKEKAERNSSKVK